MLVRLFVISMLSTACLYDGIGNHTAWVAGSVGINFAKYHQIHYIGDDVRRNTVAISAISGIDRNLIPEFFIYIEEINQKQIDGTHIYKYAHPYYDCKDTFIVNQRGIVIEAYDEGKDCNAWD